MKHDRFRTCGIGTCKAGLPPEAPYGKRKNINSEETEE